MLRFANVFDASDILSTMFAARYDFAGSWTPYEVGKAPLDGKSLEVSVASSCCPFCISTKTPLLLACSASPFGVGVALPETSSSSSSSPVARRTNTLGTPPASSSSWTLARGAGAGERDLDLDFSLANIRLRPDGDALRGLLEVDEDGEVEVGEGRSITVSNGARAGAGRWVGW